MLGSFLMDKKGIGAVGDLFVKIAVGIFILVFVFVIYSILGGDLSGIASNLGNKFRFG